MSCFEVQVLEPNISTIEIETCINGQVASLDIIQYDIASLEVTHCVALLPSDYDTIVSGIVPVWNILSGTGIYVSSNSGIFTINASGLQPSGNYSLVGHSHLSSDITNFDSSVSGLLPVKNILSGSGIQVTENNGAFTVAVTGNFGLTSEEVDDRVGSLLSAGQNILLDYNDSGNLLTISTVGLQPTGNYSLVGHYHNSSDILDFITAVSGLLPNTYDAAVPWTPNHTLIDGTRYLAGDLVYENGRLFKANYDNESLPVSNTTYWTDVGPGYRLNIDGRDIPNIPYPVTSVNGHVGDVELSTLDLDDFTNAVSGLLPSIPSVSGVGYIVSDFTNNTYIISATGLQPSGNYSIVGHSHVSNDITNFNTSVSGLLIPYAQLNSPSFSGVPTVPTAASGTNTNQIASTSFVRTEISNLVNSAPSTLDTLNELALALGSDPNFATTVASGLSQKSNIGHTHTSSNITDFNSSVSGLLPVTNITGSSGIVVSQDGTTYNVTSSGLAYTSGANFNNLSVNNIPVSVSGHQHNYTDIINFASGVDQTVSTLLVAGNYINIDYDNIADTLTISATGLQPSGNYANSVHSHGNITSSGTIGSISGLLVTTTTNGALTTSSGISSSYITNFNSAVSGLLLVKDIVGGSGIQVGSSSGIYTLTVTGGIVAASASSLITEVYNNTASTIPKMSVVYINGGHGNLPTISLAIANGEAGSSKTYGITAENILPNSNGDVVVLGSLIDVDTNQFGVVEGTTLYLSPSVSGALTTTKPLAPYHLVSVGKVVRNHNNQGVIQVAIQNGFELGELHNVSTNHGSNDGQFLQYNNASGLWMASSSGNFSTLLVNGTGVSLNGHTHTSSNITDFSSSVSGLLPVTDIIGGTNISVTPSGSIYTISVSGSLGLTTEEVDDRVSNLLVAGTGISLNYDDNANSLTISTTSNSILSDVVGSTNYIGTAPYGSSTSSSVWTIHKTVYTSGGLITSSTTAINVKWDDRLTATYS